MSTIRLSHDTAPEDAEALVWRDIARGDRHIMVSLNGFPAGQFRTIADRLPPSVEAKRTSHNTFSVSAHTTGLDVVSWNVYEGHKPADVRKQLQAMIALHRPDVIVLQEAIKQYGHLEGLGYHVEQLSPRTLHKGNKSETANVAILVRDGLSYSGVGSLTMTTPWKGPKHGLPHDPRVYRTLTVRKGGRSWRLVGAHGPFGLAARSESLRRVRDWLTVAALTGDPVIDVGDQNMTRRELAARLGTGVKVAGHRIDLAAYRNTTLLGTTLLGFRDSDHQAVLFRFRAH